MDIWNSKAHEKTAQLKSANYCNHKIAMLSKAILKKKLEILNS